MILIIFSYYYFFHRVLRRANFAGEPSLLQTIHLRSSGSSLDAELSEQRLLLPNLSDYRLLKSVTSEGTRNFIIITSSNMIAVALAAQTSGDV